MSPFFPNKPPIEWDSRQYVTWKIWAEAQNQDCWEILDSTLNLLNPSQLPVAQFWNTQVQCRLLQVIDLFNSRARQIAQLQDIQNCLQINNIRLAWLENRVRFEPDQETPLRATLNEASLLRTGAALVEQQLSGDFPRILSEWLLVPNRCRITTACGLLDRLIQNTNEHIRHLYDRIELEGAILNELLGNNPHGFIPSPSELFIVSPETVVVSLVGSLILLFIILFLWRKGCFPMGGRIKARPEDDSELGQSCLLEMDNATLNRFSSPHYSLLFVTAGASPTYPAASH